MSGSLLLLLLAFWVSPCALTLLQLLAPVFMKPGGLWLTPAAGTQTSSFSLVFIRTYLDIQNIVNNQISWDQRTDCGAQAQSSVRQAVDQTPLHSTSPFFPFSLYFFLHLFLFNPPWLLPFPIFGPSTKRALIFFTRCHNPLQKFHHNFYTVPKLSSSYIQ